MATANWWDTTTAAAPRAPTAPGYTPPTTGPFAPGQPTGLNPPTQAIPRTPPAGALPATSGSVAPPGFQLDPTTGMYVPIPGYQAPTSTPPPTAAPPPAGGGAGAPAIPGLKLGVPAAAPGLPPGFGDPNNPNFSPPGYTPPDPFQAPSIDEAMNNPGYKFAQQQGQAALQNWAAAKGTLNDSETANALTQFGQNAAEQNYQQVYNNELQRYMTNYATQYTDPYAINFQKNATQFSNAQTSWQDLYNSWLASQQLLQGEQGLVISGSNATNP